MAWHPECLRVDSPNFGYPRGSQGQLRANVQQVGGGGVFFHSTVGSWQAARDRFLNPTEEASAHFIIRQVGVPLQMVDSADCSWHAGGQIHDDPLPGGPVVGDYANLFFHGIEVEGGPVGNESEPWMDNQFQWALKLSHWLEDVGDWPRRGVYILKETLWEHNWVYPTACPSGRDPWTTLIPALAIGGGQDMPLSQDDLNAVGQVFKDVLRAPEFQANVTDDRVENLWHVFFDPVPNKWGAGGTTFPRWAKLEQVDDLLVDKIPTPDGQKSRMQQLTDQAAKITVLDVNALATAIVAHLPPATGGLTAAQVTAAVKVALKEGAG